MNKIYVIRHCEAEGQSPESQLTEKGFKQAGELADFFYEVKVDRIISSPFIRAIQTIKPLADNLKIDIEVSKSLSERILSDKNMPDWFEKLKSTYEELDLKYEGGESSREAMNRIVGVVEDIFNAQSQNTVIVTHGNLMSLLLKYYDGNFGFEEWTNFSNPDVFELKLENNQVSNKRIWVEK
ncbi:histidine phosphatase family protein [Salipaludibacillus neizhouensis]|uniref:Histidine phosphatase family protein n=1 Tax=Salipaludibacillus neizhouensis TaxID=885475 RepID=A0A3A9JW71_9BACI|nr:histidine phosphatase family protein [Salipaludibacillus neizhouensis]RKL65154.1 histidine phosphatase family protein [Salipaludibacillus neizhouensis]